MRLSLFEAEKQIGTASGDAVATSNLILTNSSSFGRLAEPAKRVRAEFHHAIARVFVTGLHANQTIARIVAALTSAADHAQLFRQPDVVDNIGQLLVDIPSAQQLGNYYRAIALYRGGHGDIAGARFLFEQVAEYGPQQHRARAMHSLGAQAFRAGDLDMAMSLYRDAMRIATSGRAFDPVNAWVAAQGTAVVKSADGDHRGALADLEKMVPLVQGASSLQPFAYYDYLNSLAVELSAEGRLEQARRASEIALRSPYAPAYHDWQETFEEIQYKQRRASRSVVAVPKQVQLPENVLPQQRKRANPAAQGAPLATRDLAHREMKQSGNLLLLPVAKRAANSATGEANGRVLAFQKKTPVFDKPNHLQLRKLTREQMYELTTPQKLMRIVDLISRDETDDEMIDRMLEAVEEIALGDPDGQVS